MNPLASLGFIIRGKKYMPRPWPGKWPELVTSFIKPVLITVYYLETVYFSLHFSCLKVNPNFVASILFIIKARQLPKATHFKTRGVQCSLHKLSVGWAHSSQQAVERRNVSYRQPLLAWGAKRLLL